MTHIPADLKNRWALRIVEDVWFSLSQDVQRYCHAIRFSNGKTMLLQMIPERVCFMVLSLGSDKRPCGYQCRRDVIHFGFD